MNDFLSLFLSSMDLGYFLNLLYLTKAQIYLGMINADNGGMMY